MTNCRLALAPLLAPLGSVSPRFALAQAADLIVTNARIYTGDENRCSIPA